MSVSFSHTNAIEMTAHANVIEYKYQRALGEDM
jgi:hypothetical protein